MFDVRYDKVVVELLVGELLYGLWLLVGFKIMSCNNLL